MLRTLMFTLLTAGIASAQLAWQDTEVARMQVSFPQQPKVRLSSEATPVGPVVSQNFEVRGASYSLAANSARLPATVLSFRSPEALYKDAAEGLLKDHRGTQQALQSITLAGQPGAELTFTDPEDGQGKARFVLLDNTLYTTVCTWKDASPPPAVEKFFNSQTWKKS